MVRVVVLIVHEEQGFLMGINTAPSYFGFPEQP